MRRRKKGRKAWRVAREQGGAWVRELKTAPPTLYALCLCVQAFDTYLSLCPRHAGRSSDPPSDTVVPLRSEIAKVDCQTFE